MKKALFLSLMASLSVSGFSETVLAKGAVSGGGGKGVVCRDRDGRVVSAELLDLWEARTIFGRKVERTNLPVKEQVVAAAQKMLKGVVEPRVTGQSEINSYAFKVELQRTINQFLGKMPNVIFLRGVDLTLTDDSYEAAVPRDCKVEQIVNFLDSQDDPKVLVNADLFDRLPLTDQAGLILHEAQYAALRQLFEEASSVRTRRTVGYLFSGGEFSDFNTTLGNEYLMCDTPGAPKDKSASVFFYEKDKFLTATATLFGGTASIGLYPAMDLTKEWINKLFPRGLDSMIDKGICVGKNSLKNQFGTFRLPLPGLGVADFQRKGFLIISCKGKKLELRVTSVDQSGSADSTPLSCQLVRR